MSKILEVADVSPVATPHDVKPLPSPSLDDLTMVANAKVETLEKSLDVLREIPCKILKRRRSGTSNTKCWTKHPHPLRPAHRFPVGPASDSYTPSTSTETPRFGQHRRFPLVPEFGPITGNNRIHSSPALQFADGRHETLETISSAKRATVGVVG